MRAAAAVLESRRQEITGWLVRESGGTRAKAALEWDLVVCPREVSGPLTSRDEGRGPLTSYPAGAVPR
jgi:aldehyde dehydrogenase (NAD+)